MRRIRKRLLGAIVGATLGLWVAGWSASYATPPAVESAPELAGDASVAQSGKEPVEKHTHPPAHGDHHDDAGTASAKLLVPKQSDIPFYPRVLAVVATLFVLAIVLGNIALKLKGPDLPDPAASDHGHDDHGHDDHAHGDKAHGHDSHAHGKH